LELDLVTDQSTFTQQSSTPLGVSILALLSVIVGIFSIWMGVNTEVIRLGHHLTLVEEFKLSDMILGILLIIAGFGLWKMKYWGWLTIMVIAIISLMFDISIVLIDWESIHRYILAILIHIVLIAYLLQPEIKNRFLI
jgi:hypothetical protein